MTRPSTTSQILLLLLGSAAIPACADHSSDDCATGGGLQAGPPSLDAAAGAAGNAADETGVAGAGPLAQGGGAGAMGTAGGRAGSTETAAGGFGAAGSSVGGVSGAIDPFAVSPSLGCGTPAPHAIAEIVTGTLVTRGNKPEDTLDSKSGPWEYERHFAVRLPAGYDPAVAYPLVLQAPGCGGTELDVLGLDDLADSVIKVSIAPPPDEIGHATNPEQGCFDDKDGLYSVEWVFYEQLMDLMKARYCYDQNRVFAGGNSSGAWLANELGCKYSGNANGYRIRGVLAMNGGLPFDPYRPVCSELSGEALVDDGKMAGVWVITPILDDSGFEGYLEPVRRAMAVNGCSIGTGYVDAMLEKFPLPALSAGSALPDDTCNKILGCPEEYPLVVCLVPGESSSFEAVAASAFSTLVNNLRAP